MSIITNKRNRAFNFHSTNSESSLLNSLIKEAISIYGLDFIYIPRKFVNKDRLYGEDVLSAFEESYEMVFYVKSFDQYGGESKILSKFGLDLQDQATLIVARDTFSSVMSPTEITQPRVGDMLYFNIDKKLFQITNVLEESIFFQLGKLYTYELTIEIFDYSDEKLKTGIDDIDLLDNINDDQYEIKVGTGTGNYQVDEQVYIGSDFISSTFNGIVDSYDVSKKVVVISSIDGEFTPGQILIGSNSDAEHPIISGIKIKDSKTVKYDNKNIQTESTPIIHKDPTDDDFGYGD